MYLCVYIYSLYFSYLPMVTYTFCNINFCIDTFLFLVCMGTREGRIFSRVPTQDQLAFLFYTGILHLASVYVCVRVCASVLLLYIIYYLIKCNLSLYIYILYMYD